jgi:hypothetical protein
MNQNTIYNPKRFRRRRTSAVPSLQSKCYFHINKTSERPKTLKLKFKLQQTNFLITANSVQKELQPRFFPHSIPKHSAVRHSTVDSYFSCNSVVKQSNKLDTFSEYTALNLLTGFSPRWPMSMILHPREEIPVQPWQEATLSVWTRCRRETKSRRFIVNVSVTYSYNVNRLSR